MSNLKINITSAIFVLCLTAFLYNSLSRDYSPVIYDHLEKVMDTTSTDISITICEGDTVNGHTETGMYVDTFTVEEPNDSIVNLIKVSKKNNK